MNEKDAERIVAEWDASRDRSLPPALQAVETALFLEDTFGVVLADESIDPEVLERPGAMLALVDGRRAR